MCLATKTIAAHFGVTVRYVQKALKKLRESGKISREWDYGLRTRRRFYLGSEQPLLMNEQEGVESTNSGAPTAVSPLDSPNRSLERASLGSGGEPEPPPLAPQIDLSTETDKDELEPEPAAMTAIVERVVNAVRPEPKLAERVADLARTWGLPCLAKAVERLERCARREPIRDARAYLAFTTRQIAADGGPGPDVTAPPPTASPGAALSAGDEALAAKWAAEQRAWEEAGMPLYT